MKRDIIFRGKRTDNGEWVYGFYSNKKGEDGRFHYIQNENLVVRVDPSTVGQYTGITDKKGTKIFEGDIIAARSIKSIVMKQVVFDTERGLWMAKPINGNQPFDLCEFAGISSIIGNIHDYTELMKGDNQ